MSEEDMEGGGAGQFGDEDGIGGREFEEKLILLLR